MKKKKAIDGYIEHLEYKFGPDSSGTAKCVIELIASHKHLTAENEKLKTEVAHLQGNITLWEDEIEPLKATEQKYNDLIERARRMYEVSMDRIQRRSTFRPSDVSLSMYEGVVKALKRLFQDELTKP